MLQEALAVYTAEEAKEVANRLGYPVLVRPSYVLGGQGMQIAFNDDEIEELEKAKAQSSSDNQADGSADTSFVVTGDGKPVDTNKQNSEADNTSALSSCDNASDSSNVLVNINTAGVDELCTLSGIGKSRADAIIAYRNENGPFKSIEDIKKVSGIKDKVFEQIKDSITV